MATLIDTINNADRIANLWRGGSLLAVNAQERLTELGFYAVAVGEQSIVAWLNGHRFEMPAAQALPNH
ncbi:hypothetical protein [Mesorhizobium sp. LSHC414A00]|uniref:hypothetical protein n=1 Tax=Mesorhizobium sp. LSHC414A00 TaxID=1287287 RepID=UPI0003CEC475|nr:hypothetical protein [Mesorhizobium sp. LSHC414A00]ESX78504.1 hypothetical protein X757_09225 [Mesorhizobium sp. LSHC414A00]